MESWIAIWSIDYRFLVRHLRNSTATGCCEPSIGISYVCVCDKIFVHFQFIMKCDDDDDGMTRFAHSKWHKTKWSVSELCIWDFIRRTLIILQFRRLYGCTLTHTATHTNKVISPWNSYFTFVCVTKPSIAMAKRRLDQFFRFLQLFDLLLHFCLSVSIFPPCAVCRYANIWKWSHLIVNTKLCISVFVVWSIEIWKLCVSRPLQSLSFACSSCRRARVQRLCTKRTIVPFKQKQEGRMNCLAIITKNENVPNTEKQRMWRCQIQVKSKTE